MRWQPQPLLVLLIFIATATSVQIGQQPGALHGLHWTEVEHEDPFNIEIIHSSYNTTHIEIYANLSIDTCPSTPETQKIKIGEETRNSINSLSSMQIEDAQIPTLAFSSLESKEGQKINEYSLPEGLQMRCGESSISHIVIERGETIDFQVRIGFGTNTTSVIGTMTPFILPIFANDRSIVRDSNNNLFAIFPLNLTHLYIAKSIDNGESWNSTWKLIHNGTYNTDIINYISLTVDGNSDLGVLFNRQNLNNGEPDSRNVNGTLWFSKVNSTDGTIYVDKVLVRGPAGTYNVFDSYHVVTLNNTYWAAWVENTTAMTFKLMTAYSGDGGTSWSTPEQIGTTDTNTTLAVYSRFSPRMANMPNTNDLVLVYNHGYEGNVTIAQYSASTLSWVVNGTAITATGTDTEYYKSWKSVAASYPTGQIHILFANRTTGTTNYLVQYARYDGVGAWTFQTLGNATYCAINCQVGAISAFPSNGTYIRAYYASAQSGGASNLTYQISLDNGLTWDVANRQIIADNQGLYNYAAGASRWQGSHDPQTGVVDLTLWNATVYEFGYIGLDAESYATIQCYDEQDGGPRNFIGELYNDNNQSIQIANTSSYTILNSTLNSSRLRLYATCDNGTQRMYLLDLDNQTHNIYTLAGPEGQQYTIEVRDATLPTTIIPNSIITIHRFIYTPDNSWEIVEQGITGNDGRAPFYLQPSGSYRITITAPEYNPITNQNITPSSFSNPAIFYLEPTSQAITAPAYETIWMNVSVNLTPNQYFWKVPFNITMDITDNASSLIWYSMSVVGYDTINGTNVTNCNVNTTVPPGSASGGTITCGINCTGNSTWRYVAITSFQTQNYSTYENPPTFYFCGNATGMDAAQTQWSNNPPFSDWGYILLAIICTMIVSGYAARYSMDGAAFVGLFVLIGFTIFNPNAAFFDAGFFTPRLWGITTLAAMAMSMAWVARRVV